MTPTSSIDFNSVAAVNAATKAAGKSTMDQNDFLTLLTTQLQTQDPFSPMDPSQMMAQMSQLTNNAGIAEMNASLKSILEQIDGGSVASWIGKNALIQDNSVSAGSNGSYSGIVSLDKAADSITIDLLDGSGQVVHSDTKTNVAAGDVDFNWDGKADGSTVPGPLKVRVTARSGTTALSTKTHVWTPVTAVQSPAGGTDRRLVTPNGLIAPDAAVRLG